MGKIKSKEEFWKHKETKRKDDSGADAMFTEQGSSASQTTAAKMMDVIARLPGCDGQAADAISDFSQVQLENALRLLKIPKERMSTCLDTSSTTQKTKIMGKHWRSHVTSWTKLTWSPISCCHGRDNSKKLYLFLDGRKYRIGNVCSFIEYRSFLSIRVDDIKNVWKEAEYGSHVEEIDEQFWILTTTSFLDHEHSGNANRMKQLLNSMRRCLNRVFLLKQTKNCPDGKNLKQKQ